MTFNPLIPGVVSNETVLGISPATLTSYQFVYLVVVSASGTGSTSEYLPVEDVADFQLKYPDSSLTPSVNAFFNLGGFGLRAIRVTAATRVEYLNAIARLQRDTHEPGIICCPLASGLSVATERTDVQAAGDLAARRIFGRYLCDLPPAIGTQALLTTERALYSSASGQTMIFHPWMNGSTVAPSLVAAAVMMFRIRRDGLGNAAAGKKFPLPVTTLDFNFTNAQYELFYKPLRINAIRSFRRFGICIDGYRTLSNEPAFLSGVARQVFDALGATLEDALQTVVFDGLDNGEALQEIRAVGVSVCSRAYALGWLYGETENDAYHVECSPLNNPDENLELLQVTLDVYAVPSPYAEAILVNRIRVNVGEIGTVVERLGV